MGGTERPYFARLGADGALDTSFNPEVDRETYSISMQSDGRILVGGAGVTFRRIVRLLNDPATQRLSVPDSGRIEWLRGGSSQETQHVTFELSVDGGAIYSPLGPGTRISGGWELAGLSLPPAGQIRARARAVGGQNNGSSGLIETESAFSGTPVAEISVRGNGSGISNGDETPDQIDHTDFGTALIPGAAITRTFTVANLGTAALTLGAVAVVGPGAGDFSVTASPDSLVNGGSSTALQIAFAPTSVGLRSATVTLVNNDADENPFAFSIQGTGVLNTPEITVTGNGAGIVDGDVSPSVADNTDFGGINISAQPLVRTFVVRNDGVAPLAFSSVTVSGAHASDFTVATQPFSPVGPGNLTTFQIAFDPSTVGLRTATVTLANNDLDENPFDFVVQGTGVSSSNTDLSGLTLSRGTLTPVFAPGTTSYAAALGFNSSSIRVTPTSADGYAAIQVRVNGGAYQGVVSGSQSGALALNVGPNAVEVLVTAQAGTTTKTYNVNVVRAASAAGDVKPDFNPDVDGLVRSIAPQKDGKIMIGGEFTSVGGIERNHIARLNADGTLDPSFNPGVDSAVHSGAVQSDGAIVIGGNFLTVAGASRSRVARLNLDGTLDPAFDPSVNGMVHGMMLQPDGKIVIGGLFGTVGGLTHNSVARLNVDGTPDPAFVAGANNSVYGMAQQGDGRILIVGAFTFVNGVPRNRMARLNPDGTLDGSFNPNLNFGAFCTAVQPDGKILVGGVFSSVGGTARNNVARLNPDGTLDTTFNPNPGFWVRSLTLQADGKILLGGSFTSVGGIPRNYVARLNPDGSLDAAFNPSAQASIWSTAIEADGKILIAGDFTSVDGVSRNHLARLDNDPATESLTATGTQRIEWLRSGSSPETHQVTFELSVDGGTGYSALGPGARINGGWELAGLGLPPAGQIRARASTAGGENNGSSGLVETVTAFTLPPPIPGITISDATVTEGDTGVSNAVFTLTLLAPSSDTVTVSALTSNLSASAGSDYTAVGPTTVTFAPTVTTQTFSVPVIGDTDLESDETFLVTLSSPVNATIVDDTALGAITNDDGEPPSRVFVSASGNDTNVCMTQTTPCRNLTAAIGQLAIDGEVIVLTSGESDNAPILIGKGVKITSPSGTMAFIRQPIIVNAPGARVALRGLTLKGNAASSGITLTAADSLSIEDTTVDGWGVGLDIANAAPSSVAITRTTFQSNQAAVRDIGPATNRVAIVGSGFEGNGTGLSASGGTHTVSECSFVANTVAISVSSGLAEINRTELWGNGTGLAVLSGGTARIGRSHVFGNTTGLSAAGGSTLASSGSNVIRGNGTNVDGAVTTVPEQ